jgi:hypothetical protein
MNAFRNPSKLGWRWFGYGRERMLEVCNDLGIKDVCTCDPIPALSNSRIRKNSGITGMRECKECHHLVWPLSYVYDCDECTEPVLSDEFPPVLDFICYDCAINPT